MKSTYCPTNLPTGIKSLFPHAGNTTQRAAAPAIMPRAYTMPPAVTPAVMPHAYTMPTVVAPVVMPKAYSMTPSQVTQAVQQAKKALPSSSLDDLQKELYPALSFVGNTSLSALLITGTIAAVVNPLNVVLAAMAENASKMGGSTTQPLKLNRATFALYYAGYVPSVLGGLKRSSYSLTVKKHLTESGQPKEAESLLLDAKSATVLSNETSQPKEAESLVLDAKSATVLSNEAELLAERETPSKEPMSSQAQLFDLLKATANIGVLGGSAWVQSKLTHKSELVSIFAQNAGVNKERYGSLESIIWTLANWSMAKSTMPLRTSMSIVNLSFMTIFQERLTDMFFTQQMRKEHPKTTSSLGGGVSGMFAALINYPLRNMFSDIMRSAKLDDKGHLIFDENVKAACKRYQSDFFKIINTQGACKSLLKAHRSRIALRVASSAPTFAIVAGMLSLLGPKPIEDTAEYVTGVTSKKVEHQLEEQSDVTCFKR